MTRLLISCLLLLIFTGKVFSIELHPKVKLNGYSSFEYEYELGNTGQGDKNGSFDADLFDLVLNIFPTERVRVSTDLTWEHGSATEDNRGNVAVEYAFAEYVQYEWLKFRVGKSFTHFGIYNEIHTAKPAFLTVKEPQSTNKNQKFGSSLRFYPRWGNGVAVLGDTVLNTRSMDYILQLTNGDSDNSNAFEEDDNSQKSLSGRVRYEAMDQWNLGLSFYGDTRQEYDNLGNDTGENTKLFSYGLFSNYHVKGLGFEFEYVGGSVKPSTGVDIKRWACTAMLSYNLYDKYTPYLRYEYLDPNQDISSDEASLYILGLKTDITTSLSWKFEIDHTQSSINNSAFNGVDFTELKTSIVVGF